MTQGFVPVVRRLPPAVATADIAVEAPPGLPPSTSPGLLARLLPVVMSVATLGVMAAAFLSGAGVARNPMFLAFPMMMLVSIVVTAITARGRGQGRSIDADRVGYLEYLSRLRRTVTEIAVAQRSSLNSSHPDPDTLWTLIGGPRMWERRATDSDFCLVRVGVGTQPLAARLVPPGTPSQGLSDPVTATALRRLIHTHSTIADAPITIGLHGIATVTIDGDPTLVRGLLRAMICQLAVLHPPDQLLIAGVISGRNHAHWDWLKWLPHNQHPGAADAVGSARMVYRSPAEAQHALAGAALPHVVVVADLDERADPAGADAITGVTILRVGTGCDGAPLTIRQAGEAQALLCPDRMDPVDTLVCARRLAMYRVGAAGEASARDGGPGWPSLVGLGDVARYDPITLWRSQDHHDRLCVPIGTTVDGAALELDIKEPAENGMGPHGLCVGATGSGKSELLRTIALGMMARNCPEVLNLLLIDFKGGATFLDLARAPHVAAVITNLSDEAPLVARMRDALAGEMDRRQRLLRAAGCVSVAAHERARRAGRQLTTLPTLFIIVDEFSELLSQHPDFADMFVAIGRLGRSLGMHLLLASQRLDEGRLRGLEAHLSYRMCLKTLSPGESRTVLGTLDAYQLPNTPGAGFLRSSSGELTRFQAAFVSGPLRADTQARVPTAAAPTVRPFSTRAAGPVTRAIETGGSAARTVLHAVVDRLSGHGPPAHQVWLPPLGPAPALDTLLRDAVLAPAGLTVPIGMIDRPFEQCWTPLTVDLSGAAGNVAVVGAPQSGKSTALRTMITALAATHDPGQVQFYCLDFGGGALASVRTLPHVGAVAGRAEPRLVGRIVAECESVVRSREAIFSDRGIGSIAEYRQRRAVPDNDPFGDVFLVVDGWASLRHEFEALEASITTLAAQGLSFGVHVTLSASRWAEIRPSLKDQIGTRIELRLGDPADSELDRKRAQQVPQDRPGHGLSRDGLHMVIALPRVDGISHGESVAPPIPLLPTRVDHDTVVDRAGTELGARMLLGLEERRLQPVAVDFEQYSHLLVLGDNECGKTATLRTLCREIVRTKTAAEAQLLIVDFRRSLLGVVESEHFGGYAMSPAALGALLPGLLDLLRRRMPPSDASQAQLRARSWWAGPDIYVLVDDYDLVATSAGNPLAAILEYLPHARDLGLHLVVARRSGGAERALFEPLLAGLRDFGCMGLMMSGRPDEGALFGSGRPARLPPGRGVLITRAGDEQLVQVAWSPPP
ncbi:MAG TPA: type VII secretion protein EccCa [Mycobacterium sp.]|nr:type VII secretion protein EccCa [Mycobacterium sp.]HUH71238.1 type VII secretion protein EccCa [Mycobacterium sp.]